MTTLASDDRSRYDLTRLDDQRAYAAELMARERRADAWQRAKIALVWLALFGLLGVMLYLR